MKILPPPPPNKKCKNCFKIISNLLSLWYRMSRFCCNARKQPNAGIINISTPDLVTLKLSFNKAMKSLANTGTIEAQLTAKFMKFKNCFNGEIKKVSFSVTLVHWKNLFFFFFPENKYDGKYQVECPHSSWPLTGAQMQQNRKPVLPCWYRKPHSKPINCRLHDDTSYQQHLGNYWSCSQ